MSSNVTEVVWQLRAERAEADVFDRDVKIEALEHDLARAEARAEELARALGSRDEAAGRAAVSLISAIAERERLRAAAQAVLAVDAHEGVFRAEHCTLEDMCRPTSARPATDGKTEP